jgi:hypothetical protein
VKHFCGGNVKQGCIYYILLFIIIYLLLLLFIITSAVPRGTGAIHGNIASPEVAI